MEANPHHANRKFINFKVAIGTDVAGLRFLAIYEHASVAIRAKATRSALR
jgi:hypothetical protein